MSTALSASADKATAFRKRIRDSQIGSVSSKRAKQQKASIASEANVSSNLDYLFRQAPKDSFQSTSLTGQTTIDFEIKNTPGLKTKDQNSWYIEFKVKNTDGTNAVTPAFVEAFFDSHAGLEFMCNQRQILPPYPMMQIVLENMERQTDIGYTRMSTQLNHDKSLLNTSVTSLTAGTEVKFRVRIPVPLPRNEPFWLGAINGSFTIRIRTQSGGAVAAGTGVLALTGIELVVECNQVDASEKAALVTEWANKVWKFESSRLNEVSSQVVASTGQYLFQLQALKDQPVTRIISFAHASRTSFATATSYFLFLAPDTTTCNVSIQDKSGTQLFTSNKEGYGFNRYLRQIRQYGSDSPMPNVPFILNNAAPDLEEGQLKGQIDEVFVFTGDENLSIENFGSAATTMFLDSIAFIETVAQMKDGEIYVL
jgi:hypothetical protein